MNERVKKLAEQAMGTRKHVPPVWQFYDTELEKFAELIVKECCQLVEDTPGVSWDDIENIQANIKTVFRD